MSPLHCVINCEVFFALVLLLYALLFDYTTACMTHVVYNGIMCELRERFTMLVLFLARRMAGPQLSRAMSA